MHKTPTGEWRIYNDTHPPIIKHHADIKLFRPVVFSRRKLRRKWVQPDKMIRERAHHLPEGK